jgi:hypothetical protein
MTHDARLPTLEEVMNGSPFDIVDSPWGHIERWRASTLATGTMGALSNVYDIVRSDSAAFAARADEAEARNALIQHLCEKVDEFQRRFDDHEARLAEAEDARRADQAAAHRFDEEPLTLPPDISEKQSLAPPAELGAHSSARVGDDTHQSGEEPPSELPEPPLDLEADGDELGDLPEELRDLPDPTPEPRGTVYPQPTAISLNKE